MTKNTFKNSHGFISLPILLIIMAVGLVASHSHKSIVDFAYYEPTYLPQNVSIKAKRISLTRHRPPQVEQNFRTEDWVYAISEEKATQPIGSAAQDYDDNSIEPTCNIETSPAKTTYRLCHWIDYGRIDVHEVKFIKNGTFIYVQIPTTVDQKISIKEISKFVDSFEQRSTLGFPILRTVV